MAVEQLDDGRGLPQRADPLVDAFAVDRIGHPDPSVDVDGVRRARQHLLGRDPAEAVLELVDEAEAHRKRSRSAGITRS